MKTKNKLLAAFGLFGICALAACQSGVDNSNNSGSLDGSISQGSGNTGIQSGRNAAGKGKNSPCSDGTTGNTAQSPTK